MAMYTIDAALVKQFNSAVEILSQQKGSRLRGSVRLKTGVVGEDTYLDQIGKTSAVKRTTRHADTPIVDTEWQRRKISMIDYDWGDYIDTEDKLKMLADPTSEYVMNASYALGRALDIEIIDKVFGTAYIGKTGADTETFPSGNVVAVGASGMTLAKLLAIKEILDDNDIDPDEPRYIAVSSKQIQDMLKIDEFISADFNTVKALVAGARLPFGFMGFTFIPVSSSILATDSNSYRRVIAWAKNGIGLAISRDITTDVSVDIKKNMSTLIQAHIGCGSARLDSDKVVECKCDES
uniref:Putative capsid protein n=1 Tax=viral metagenome TaxID=1070528 RepID=A0A6M3K434_9ZZZZ